MYIILIIYKEVIVVKWHWIYNQHNPNRCKPIQCQSVNSVFATYPTSTSFNACHWERNDKNSSQTTGSCVTSSLQLILKYLFQPCKFAKYLPEIRIWHESECEWGGCRGKNSTRREQESITFSAEPNRGQLMYRLFVPTHVFSSKRSRPIMTGCSCVETDFGA